MTFLVFVFLPYRNDIRIMPSMEAFLGTDLISLIKTAGYLGLFGIVFAESGLLVGFFLPGDSLLFTAGFLASQGYLNIILLVSILFIAAVSGDSVGYAFGRRIGPRLFTRENSFFFHKQHIERAQRYYELHGGKTILLARFMPIVRTCAPVVAGVGRMQYTRFLFYNLLGGALWAAGLTLFGYYLGSAVPHADRYITPIVLAIIFLSCLPVLYHAVSDPEKRNVAVGFLKRKIKK